MKSILIKHNLKTKINTVQKESLIDNLIKSIILTR